MTNNTAIFYIRYTQEDRIYGISFWENAIEAEIIACSVDDAIDKLTKILGKPDYANKWVFKVDKISMIGLEENYEQK